MSNYIYSSLVSMSWSLGFKNKNLFNNQSRERTIIRFPIIYIVFCCFSFLGKVNDIYLLIKSSNSFRYKYGVQHSNSARYDSKFVSDKASNSGSKLPYKSVFFLDII